MAWKIELSESAERQIKKLDRQHSKRILKFLRDRVAHLDDPRSLGKALQGPEFGELWRYRVGDFRIICKIEDGRLVVLVIRVGHPNEIYR
jgi:mRNA interferase RelE/StbE